MCIRDRSLLAHGSPLISLESPKFQIVKNNFVSSETLTAAINYSSALNILVRYGEAKTLLKKVIPAARRVLGPSHEFTFRMMGCYGQALYRDPDATLDGLRESETTLEETERIARRTLGGALPLTTAIGVHLENSRAALRLRTL